MRSLPQELSDHIIDCLAPDCLEGPSKHYADLRACALTCQSWLPRAQYQLYKHVELRLLDSMRLFARTLEQFPNLCRLVKRLEFWFDEEAWDQQPSDMQDVPFPTHLIGGLMSLQELRFACCMDRRREEAAVQVDFMRKWTGCTQLRTLQLDHHGFATLEDVVRVVWSFPLLRELRLSAIIWFGLGASVDPADFPGHCQHLKVVEMQKMTIVLLPLLGTAIQKLSITCYYSLMPENFQALSTLSELRSLAIAFVRLDYPWLEMVLGKVRSAHLEELVLYFCDCDELMILARLAHRGLDDLLSRKHLESIRRLKIMLNYKTVEARLRMTEKLLPRFMKRGTIEMVAMKINGVIEDEDEDMEDQNEDMIEEYEY